MAANVPLKAHPGNVWLHMAANVPLKAHPANVRLHMAAKLAQEALGQLRRQMSRSMFRRWRRTRKGHVAMSMGLPTMGPGQPQAEPFSASTASRDSAPEPGALAF